MYNAESYDQRKGICLRKSEVSIYRILVCDVIENHRHDILQRGFSKTSDNSVVAMVTDL